MLNRIVQVVLLGSIAAIMACCSTSGPQPKGKQVARPGPAQPEQRSGEKMEQPPDWVMNPVVKGGLAATSCVNQKGNWSQDKQRAILNAKSQILEQIDQKIV